MFSMTKRPEKAKAPAYGVSRNVLVVVRSPISRRIRQLRLFPVRHPFRIELSRSLNLPEKIERLSDRMDLAIALRLKSIAAVFGQLINSLSSNRINFIANAPGWLVLRLHLLICVWSLPSISDVTNRGQAFPH